MAEPGEDSIARNRWLLINLARIGGVLLTVLGVLVLAGGVELPRMAGWIALALGLPAAFVLPQLLVRRWRSPRP
jgi:hypothetical protein